MSDSLPLQHTPEQIRGQFEWALDIEYAAHRKMSAPTSGLLRLTCGDWVTDQLIGAAMVERVHVEALRRISAALGNPLRDARQKTALDLADIAVAKILACDPKMAGDGPTQAKGEEPR